MMHPFTKLVIVFCLTTASLLYPLVPVQAALLAVSLGLLLSKKRDTIHLSKLLKNLRRLTSVVCSIFILQTFFVHTGKELLRLGWLHINLGGIQTATVVSLRLIILVLIAGWLLGLSIKDYLTAFYTVRMPETLAVMTALTIGFIPLLAQQIADENEQIKLRGIDLRKLGLKVRFRLYRSLIMPVLGKTMQDVKFQAIALDLRGFRNGKKHTRFETQRLKWADLSIIGLAVVLTWVPAFL